jgi:2-polyprenyl-6-methoxyphenol hydroxylase-like FAD-dependent oxidoreductase
LLSRRGYDVTVFERFTESRPVGSGLMLQPTGLAAMQRLGLREAIEARGHRVDRLHGMTGTGRVVFNLSYAGLGLDRYALGVHRAALHGVLWDEFRRCDARLSTGREIVSLDDPVLADTAFVVDASGARSTLRATLSGRSPRQFPYGAVWASVPDIGIHPGTLAQRYVGASKMLGYLPVGSIAEGGAQMAALFWSLRHDGYQSWRDSYDDWRHEACALWPELSPVVDGLTGPDDFQHATYAGFDSGRPWRGKLVLIGDAAHSTSPQLGQGANQALLDAVVLADALSIAGDPPEAFALYARIRRSHVRFYQYASLIMTPFFQSDARSLAWLRDLVFDPMRRVPWLHQQMLHTLAGLKTGLFTAAQPEAIVNRLAKP